MSRPTSDPDSDPFRPPAIPTEVHCIHCGEEYESYLIEWRLEKSHDGTERGFWCCPIQGCDGKGFGFDILPTDPEYVSEDGSMMWVDDDDEEFDDDEWMQDLPPPPPNGTNDKKDGNAGGDVPFDDSDIPW